MLREVVGEGEGVKLRIIEGNEGNIVSLKDDQGRNVLDVWRKRIILAGNNYPVTSGPASNEQLVSLSNLKNLNSKITLDNIRIGLGEMESTKQTISDSKLFKCVSIYSHTNSFSIMSLGFIHQR